MAAELKPCGTRSAYDRHLRHNEEPCQPCRDASNAYNRDYRKRMGSDRARKRALAQLARNHQDEYRALYRVELAKENAKGGEPS